MKDAIQASPDGTEADRVERAAGAGELPPIQYAYAAAESAGWNTYYTGVHWGGTLDEAMAFDATGVARRASTYVSFIVPFREYVRTEPATREVVELEGVVDHGSLSGYAVWEEGSFQDRKGCMVGGSIDEARIYPSVAAVARSLSGWTREPLPRFRIVGIREKPGSVVRYREIVR